MRRLAALIGGGLLVLGAFAIYVLGEHRPVVRTLALLMGFAGVVLAQRARPRTDTARSGTFMGSLGLAPIKRVPVVGICLAAAMVFAPAYMSYAGRHYPNSEAIVWAFIALGVV